MSNELINKQICLCNYYPRKTSDDAAFIGQPEGLTTLRQIQGPADVAEPKGGRSPLRGEA